MALSGKPMTSPAPESTLKRPVDGATDRIIKVRQFTWPKVVATVAATTLGLLIVDHFLTMSDVRSFAIASELVTIEPVETGEFLDFVPIRGSVTPLNTVFLDAIEGGRVERVLVQEGSFVQEGQAILELSNTTLQLDVISREAQVSEQINNLRNTRLAMDQNRLSIKSALVEIDYQIKRLTRLTQRLGDLFDRGLIASQGYEEAADELEYYINRREVTIESQEADERMRLAQMESLESTVQQLERNLEIARANLDNLVIMAPLSGQLMALNANVGESKARGERLGQIDDVDEFKITALVDEFYVTRTQSGQSAEFDLSDRTYTLKIIKVYPEIRDGQFEIDLAFNETSPANLRRGQTLQIRVALGDSSEALLLPRGAFFQDTGGSWAFVLDDSRKFAAKHDISLGRRNPQYFEVLGGLKSGDRVITSTYSSYIDMDRVEFRD
jgi:HlyD family secretion protein